MDTMKRKVYLVGAGPGDPGLITVKGLECIKQADVIIYDRLLDERLLDSVPPEAERIYVGKASSEHAKEQPEINQLLVEKATEGKTVVRLKGGDPFVLGRGGEGEQPGAQFADGLLDPLNFCLQVDLADLVFPPPLREAASSPGYALLLESNALLDLALLCGHIR